LGEDKREMVRRVFMKVLDIIAKKLKEKKEEYSKSVVEIDRSMERISRVKEEVKHNKYLQRIVNELGKTEREIKKLKRDSSIIEIFMRHDLAIGLYRKKDALMKLLLGGKKDV
jgi:hypothetical protein